MSSVSLAVEKKVSAPRKETPECRRFDLDLRSLFVPYRSHIPWEELDLVTSELLYQFDRAGQAGVRAFADIADLSRRLVYIDVALTSHRGMLLDTLDSLGSEYDSLVDAILRGLASCAHYLLLRALLRDPGGSRLPIVDMDMLLTQWEDTLADMRSQTDVIQRRWVDVIDVLRNKLESLPVPHFLSWFRSSYHVKSSLRELLNDLPNIVNTARSNVVELMQAGTGVDLAFQQMRQSESANHLQHIETTLDELIRLNIAFMAYRAGCWIANRMAFEQGRMKDVGKSPLGDLFFGEREYLWQHPLAMECLRRLKSFK